ncbi:MAG: hypothetical protein R3F30_10420 [Planctomycetota bacterium]
MSRIPALLLLPLVLLLATDASAQRRGEDPLDLAVSRWLRDFKANRIDPDDFRGMVKKSYLTPELRRKLPTQFGPQDRVSEARSLFRLMKDRGGAEDGKDLVEVVCHGLDRKEGVLIGGAIWRFRQAALPFLTGDDTPKAFQEAVVARLEGGLDVPGPDDKRQEVRCRNELEATVLAPLVGSYGNQLHRTLLENLLRVDHADLKVAAAKGLGAMGSGSSMRLVADILPQLEYHDQLVEACAAVIEVAKGQRPTPDARQLSYALEKGLEAFEAADNWRSRLAMLPLFQALRGKKTVPALISLLEAAKKEPQRKGAQDYCFSGTLLQGVVEVLEDLTGFFAAPGEPERWRSWWDKVHDDFEIRPPELSRSRKPTGVHDKKTSAQPTFFGIPVIGSRVIFVLDISGSMLWYIDRPMPAGNPPLPTGEYESRLDRAKKELVGAIEGMTTDDMFTVVYFESVVRTWSKKLVPATKQAKSRVLKDIDKVKAWGATALYDALEEAMGIEVDRRPGERYSTPVDELFLLSDGAPTAGKIMYLDQILERVLAWNKGAKVRINTIFLGELTPGRIAPGPGMPAQDMREDEFMRRLAESSGGRFVHLTGTK